MKKTSVRKLWFALLLFLAAGSPALLAQPYPSKPVRIVVGFAAGGPTDVIARLMAQDMTASMGQTVIVENRTGANAIIATDFVARAAPDGHTALFSSLSLLVNAILQPDKIKYDPFRDFAPVSNAALLPMVIVTRPSTPVNSVRELVALAKRYPGEVTYASPGHGGSGHLAGAFLETLSGAKMTHVPFRGNAPALVDVMSGQVTFMFYPIIGIAEHVHAGKLKALAVGTAKPHPDFQSPDHGGNGLPGPRRHRALGRRAGSRGDARRRRQQAFRRDAQIAGAERDAGTAENAGGKRRRRYAGGIPGVPEERL